MVAIGGRPPGCVFGLLAWAVLPALGDVRRRGAGESA